MDHRSRWKQAAQLLVLGWTPELQVLGCRPQQCCTRMRPQKGCRLLTSSTCATCTHANPCRLRRGRGSPKVISPSNLLNICIPRNLQAAQREGKSAGEVAEAAVAAAEQVCGGLPAAGWAAGWCCTQVRVCCAVLCCAVLCCAVPHSKDWVCELPGRHTVEVGPESCQLTDPAV